MQNGRPSCPDLLLSSDGELDGLCFPCPANGCDHIEVGAARRGCVHRVRDKDGKRWNCVSVTAQKEAMVRKARAFAGFVKLYQERT